MALNEHSLWKCDQVNTVKFTTVHTLMWTYIGICLIVCLPLHERGMQTSLPLSAITLLAGFMMALSAEMGLRMGLLGSLMSMITTCACSPTFSRTQMNLSDSIVSVLKPMLAGLIPKFWSWGKTLQIDIDNTNFITENQDITINCKSK